MRTPTEHTVNHPTGPAWRRPTRDRPLGKPQESLNAAIFSFLRRVALLMFSRGKLGFRFLGKKPRECLGKQAATLLSDQPHEWPAHFLSFSGRGDAPWPKSNCVPCDRTAWGGKEYGANGSIGHYWYGVPGPIQRVKGLASVSKQFRLVTALQ